MLKMDCIHSISFYKNLGLDLQAFEVQNFVPSSVMIAGSLMVQSPDLYFKESMRLESKKLPRPRDFFETLPKINVWY